MRDIWKDIDIVLAYNKLVLRKIDNSLVNPNKSVIKYSLDKYGMLSGVAVSTLAADKIAIKMQEARL